MIFVNGAESDLAPGADLDSALRSLGMREEARGIAVAIDGEVVPRSQWSSRRLSEGERIELVGAVQGG